LNQTEENVIPILNINKTSILCYVEFHIATKPLITFLKAFKNIFFYCQINKIDFILTKYYYLIVEYWMSLCLLAVPIVHTKKNIGIFINYVNNYYKICIYHLDITCIQVGRRFNFLVNLLLLISNHHVQISTTKKKILTSKYKFIFGS